MAVPITPGGGAAAPQAPRWGAVFALTLCVATLIASEFMPVSLLRPIAADLHVTEGGAGQAIAVSGIFAFLASLGISSATRGVDRRAVLLGLTLLMMVSGVMVALAPNAGVFMAGRALVGIVVGGFWAMSAATVMRLVPERDVPRALGVPNGGNALATTVATCTEAALRRLWRSLCTARSSAGWSTSAKSSTRPPGAPGSVTR